jgi:hypothetical protein
LALTINWNLGHKTLSAGPCNVDYVTKVHAQSDTIIVRRRGDAGRLIRTRAVYPARSFRKLPRGVLLNASYH